MMIALNYEAGLHAMIAIQLSLESLIGWLITPVSLTCYLTNSNLTMGSCSIYRLFSDELTLLKMILEILLTEVIFLAREFDALDFAIVKLDFYLHSSSYR